MSEANEVEGEVRRVEISDVEMMEMNSLPGAFERLLVSKGLKAEGGPLLPKLTGTITMIKDPGEFKTIFEQVDA